MDHLINPDIVRKFEWDAQKVSRYDGERHTRIYTEPWTGERFWEVQVTTSELFHFKITLTNFKDIVATRCENAVPRTICRQDPALIVWDETGISCHGEDP